MDPTPIAPAQEKLKGRFRTPAQQVWDFARPRLFRMGLVLFAYLLVRYCHELPFYAQLACRVIHALAKGLF